MADNNTPTSSTPNFNKLELEILKFWEDNHIFEKSLEQTKDKEPYVFYDGPPFATGLPHYGHILGSAVKDFYGRYQTMKGRYVRRVWGWDCHGLPIENIVEQSLKISGKKQIEELGVEKFNQLCRDNVLRFAEEWGKTVKRMGRWVDFEHSYKTMDTTYQESVWWGLKQVWDKGLIYEDRKVLLYCSRCETPISNFEVAMDNSYRDITEESVYAKFKLLKGQRIINDLTNDKTYALAWTTTPWTLPGNTSLNVGPDIVYVLIEQEDGRRYILAKERLSVVEGKYEIVAEFPARALEGLQYEPLYPGVIPNARNDAPALPAGRESNAPARQDLQDEAGGEGRGNIELIAGDPARAHRIYLADFVTITDGTGIVHNAAMYGDDDYQLAKEKNLPRLDMLDHKGRYLDVPNNPEHLRGVFFKDADKIVIKDLEANGLLYKTEHYTHSYPHCYRCATPLFYNAIPAWFINIQQIKARLRELNEQQINWYPEHLKMGRFDKSMESAPDWNISRNRYWATALPFWKCENKECKNVICVGSVHELKEKSINFNEIYPSWRHPERVHPSEGSQTAEKETLHPSDALGVQDDAAGTDLHKPYIDRVILKCEKCGGRMNRVPEVVDCWVESGSMPFAELHYPFENQELFKQRMPADFVAEYIGQVRAWYYVMLVVSAINFDQAPFRNVVTTGNILAEDGSKMSKSKNNFPDPGKLIEKFGVDPLRFYLLTCPVMNADDVNFSEKLVQEVGRKISLLVYNIWSFYRMYQPRNNAPALPAGRELNAPARHTSQDEAGGERRGIPLSHILDKWIIARLNQVQGEVTKQLDGYNTAKAGKALVEFINDLSTWYLRRSRDRLKLQNEESKQVAQVLGYVLAETAKLLAPFMPFLADFIYKDVTGGESVHLTAWPLAQTPDADIIAKMEVVRELASLGLAARKQQNLPVRQPLLSLAFELQDGNGDIGPELEKLLLEELNVKQIDASLLDKDRRPDKAIVVPGAKAVKAVYLDLTVTLELKAEGLGRELERAVQDLRKKSGLKVGELVDLYYNTQDGQLEDVLLNKFDRKKTFVSQINKSLEVEVDFEIQAEVDGKPVWLGIVKM